MIEVNVSQEADGSWLVVVDGREQYAYQRLTDAIRRTGRRLGDEAGPGQSASVRWTFADDFVNEAVAVAKERRQLAEDEARIAKLTNETIVNLAQQGLSNGDIATVLALTPARVSQIVQDRADWLWGEGDTTGEVTFARLYFGNGWRVVKGRGPVPPRITFAGLTFEASGGSHAVGGQPMIPSYVEVV